MIVYKCVCVGMCVFMTVSVCVRVCVSVSVCEIVVVGGGLYMSV